MSDIIWVPKSTFVMTDKATGIQWWFVNDEDNELHTFRAAAGGELIPDGPPEGVFDKFLERTAGTFWFTEPTMLVGDFVVRR